MRASATGRRRQLTVEEQLQIVARVKNGESQSSIARELGYTRQRISAIMKKHAEVGAEGFVHKKRGRKVGPVPDEEIAGLVTMLRDQKPAQFGFARKDQWTFEKAEAAGTGVFGRKPPQRYLREAFKQAGVEITYDQDPDADIFTPEFKAYLKSDKAREIRAREAAYRKRLEEQGLVNQPSKIGRPTKAESERRAAQPWNFDVADETGANVPGDGSEDTDIPDWSNLSPEELNEVRAKYNLSSFPSAPGKPQPGNRVGKHRRGNSSSRKKRKKKRK